MKPNASDEIWSACQKKKEKEKDKGNHVDHYQLTNVSIGSLHVEYRNVLRS